ncbi:MAG: hypothetical protein ACRD8K_09045 [Nitrososphaeraceae archaeon]
MQFCRHSCEWKLCNYKSWKCRFRLDTALPRQDRWLTGVSGPAKKIEAAVQIQTKSTMLR